VFNSGATENTKGRTLPIYGDMREWLLARQAKWAAKFTACPFLLARRGRRITEFGKAWVSSWECAGLTGLVFHDLRHSAVRNMRRAGIPENVAMQITGHKANSIFDRYSIVGGHNLGHSQNQ